MFQSEKQPDRNTGKRNAENDNNKSKLSNEERYNLFFGNHLQTAQKKEDETEDELQAKMEPNYITGKRQHPETGSQDIVLSPLFSPGSNPAAQKKEEESGMGGLNPIEMLNDQKEAISKGVGMHPVQQKEIEEEKNIQKKPSETDPAKSPSTPMPENVQSKMENSFGTSFAGVNIHTNDEGAKDMGALAYTQGKDVHFAPGQYSPNTQKGQELIGHELTHVVQQREGRVRPIKQGKGLTINDNPALENEADEMGKKAAEGENAAPHQTAGNAVQRKKENSVEPEMSEEQIKSAIDCNNGLGLSALSINYLQSGLCVPQTGAFDENTVLAIGKVSIENRVEPFLADLADAKMREYINNQFDTSISEKDQKKKLKYENKLNKLGPEGSKKKKAKYKGKIQEIKDRYMSSSDQEHLERTKHLGSSANIESKIDDIRSKFTASDGQLDVSTYNTIFRQMAADGAYQQLLNISVEFAGVQQDSKTLFMQYDPASEHAYRVKVPFSQLEINNTSTESSITNAPNTLKNVFIGKNAFESHAALIGHIKTANSIQVEPNNEESQETSENNVTELTQEQIDLSMTNNSAILSSEKSCYLVQAITGALNTGSFDENTIRSISDYQTANNTSRTDGMLDKATINLVINTLNQNGLQVHALELMRDFYSLDDSSDKEIELGYSTATDKKFEKNKSLPGVEQNTFGEKAIEGGYEKLDKSFKEAFGADNTQTPKLLPNSYRVYSDSSGSIKIWICNNKGVGEEHTVAKSITQIRDDYILKQYNWNAIVGIMKYVSSNTPGYTYKTPTNLCGTTSDNEVIIPDKGILGIVELQLKQKINANSGVITEDNVKSIVDAADGQPGSSFAILMGEDSKNDLRNEEDNSSLENEDGDEIEIPDFGSDSEETLYDFMRDLTLARNGLWSDSADIVNLTGLRRELESSESEDHEVQWNDTMAASWIEVDNQGNEIKHCKHYTATTEPGNRDENRMITPQTATVLLGLHKSRQPGGRIMSPMIKGSDDDGNVYDFDRYNAAGMNIHPGGMRGYTEGNNLRGGMVLENNKLSGFSGAYGAKSETDVEAHLRLSEIFYILSKYGNDRDKTAYKKLKDLRDEAINLQQQQTPLSSEQQNALNDYERITDIFEEDEYTTSRKNYIKNTVKFDFDRENDILDDDNTTEPGVSTATLNDSSLEVSSNVSQSSEGCQVIYGGKTFYDFWWNSLNKAENSGQRRWYYTLIDITTPYNDIETEEGELTD